MPAAKNAESKQGLVVTLVFFILLSIILGVLTYTGYSGQADLEDKLKKANDDKKTIEENRTWYKAQALVYRAYIGHTSTDLAELKERHDGLKGKSLGGQSKDKDEVYKLIDQIENKEQLGWDEQTKKPKTNYLAMIEDLKRQLQENQAKLNDAEQRRNKLSADLKREQNKNKELKDFFDAELVKLNDARKKDAADAQKLTDKQRTDFGDMGKALADKQVEFDQQIKDKDAIIKKKD